MMKKVFKILKLLSTGRKVDKIEAVRNGDLSLNSTICDIQRRHGIRVSRRRKSDNYHIVEYWLEEPERLRAIAVLRKVELGV